MKIGGRVGKVAIDKVAMCPPKVFGTTNIMNKETTEQEMEL